MKTKNLILVIVTSILLIFSGCSGNTDGAKTSELFPSVGSGTSQTTGNGVDLSFAENQPGKEYNKGQPINFGFVFKNFQDEEITDMKMKITGIEWGYITGLEREYTISSIPKATPQAGPGVFTGFFVQGVTVDGFSNNYNFNPKFDYCYTTKTTFREQVCVPSKKNICDIKVEKSQYSNGPLKVTINRLVDYSDQTTGKVGIELTINNVANGKIVNECFKTEDYANKYELISVKLGNTVGTCTAVSGYQIVSGTSKIFCEFPRNEDNSYASQVTVELQYKYEQSTPKNILVKDYKAGLS